MKCSFIIVICSLLACSVANKKEHKWIRISRQGLTEVPDSIFKLKNVRSIRLGPSWVAYGPLGTSDAQEGNMIKYLPDEICNLKKLESLNLWYNDIRRLPECMGSLKELKRIDLSGNENLDYKQAVTVLSKCSSLREVSLARIYTAIIDSNWVISQFKSNVKLILTPYDEKGLIENR